VLDQLSSLIRNGSIPKDDAWRTSVVEFFVLNGWFEGVKRKKEKKGSNPGVNVCPRRLLFSRGET
jgi:hypothetical protein